MKRKCARAVVGIAVASGMLAGAVGRAGADDKTWPLWDGKETQAEYAKRAGIADVEKTLDLGSNATMKLILIPAGKFMMGNPDPTMAPPGPGNPFPLHEVTITKPFYMSVCEVTQAQYDCAVGKSGSFKRALKMTSEDAIKLVIGQKVEYTPEPNLPVDFVSWTEAVDLCKKASEIAGKNLELATEAQWEYAYRAGTTNHYYWGDVKSDKPTLFFREQAWLLDGGNAEYGDGCKPVGLKKANPWGLYDMAGNVWEWCRDAYETYPSDPVSDPFVAKPKAGNDDKIIRGGYFGNAAAWCTAWHRKFADTEYKSGVVSGSNKGRFPMQGIRVVMALEETQAVK